MTGQRFCGGARPERERDGGRGGHVDVAASVHHLTRVFRHFRPTDPDRLTSQERQIVES